MGARTYRVSGKEQGSVITGIQIREELQLLCVLLILAFVLGGIYLMQKYTGA